MKMAMIFIVGMPRSGTKLLRDLINRHPKIDIPMIETGILPYWAKCWSAYGDLSEYDSFIRFYNHSIKFPFFLHQKRRGSLVDPWHWYKRCENYSIQGVFKALLYCELERDHADGSIIGDKSPSHITHCMLLMELFPDAKIIHVVRDVRDYALSLRFAYRKNIFRAAQRWALGVTAARVAQQKFPHAILEVRYEDVLDDTCGVMHKICEFLDVEFNSDMLKLQSPSESVGSARNSSEIVKDNTNKYVNEMPLSDRLRVESIAVHAMRLFGYPVSSGVVYRPLSGLRSTALKMLDAYQLLRAGQNSNRTLWRSVYFHLMHSRASRS